MELWIRALFLCVFAGLVYADDHSKVFQSQRDASSILLRSKRANSHLFEEIQKGNLERECIEEICNYEEAREVFEDDAKTEKFWMKYIDGDQCESNPCQHGGTCVDKIGFYICNCTELYKGINCERDVSQCSPDGPLACDHFCHPSFSSFKCSCASGYQIDEDKRTCLPKGQYPCGRAPLQEVNGPHQPSPKNRPGPYLCEQGRCQWQVTLTNTTGHEFCSGVILGQHSVLTTASCVFVDPDFRVKIKSPSSQSLGKNVKSRQSSEQELMVVKILVHERYVSDLPGDDLAFLQLREHVDFGPNFYRACLPEKDFSEHVLMSMGQEGLLANSKRAKLSSYIPLEVCQSELNLTMHLTNKMFCVRNSDTDTGEVDCGGLLPGAPIITVRKQTAFLTGLHISAQEHDCRGHAFIKLSRYLPWIQNHLDNTEK